MAKKLVLMLEYDEDDQFITQEYFLSNSQAELRFCSTSDELMEYLESCRSGKQMWPSLLLLTYDSTPKNATEVLSELRADRDFKHLPAVVLSGTIIPGIVRECYESGANTFIQKPAKMEDTVNKIHTFLDYWFSTAVLPE